MSRPPTGLRIPMLPPCWVSPSRRPSSSPTSSEARSSARCQLPACLPACLLACLPSCSTACRYLEIVPCLLMPRPQVQSQSIEWPETHLCPKSLLELFAERFAHCDLISEACKSTDPQARLRSIVKFYLTMIANKPDSLQQPLMAKGEVFRCAFDLPGISDTPPSRAFLIAEQVEVSPPTVSFYISDRVGGWVAEGTVRYNIEIHNNAIVASADPSLKCKIHILADEEVFELQLPNYHVDGLLFGRVTGQVQGKAVIECSKANTSCDLHFKLLQEVPVTGGWHCLEGHMSAGENVFATVTGKWDHVVHWTDKASGSSEVLIAMEPELKDRRLPQLIVPPEEEFRPGHGPFTDSQALWRPVREHILGARFDEAKAELARIAASFSSTASLFRAAGDGNFEYSARNLAPWNPAADVLDYHSDGLLKTLKSSDLPSGTILSPEDRAHLQERLHRRSVSSDHGASGHGSAPTRKGSTHGAHGGSSSGSTLGTADLAALTQRITDLETWRASMLASQTKAGAAARAVTPTTTAAANTNPLFVIKEHAVLLVIVVIIQLFLNFVM
eukprot:m.262370 g.262370  ORF g.262370 m.262370 type:complete len:559 (+) comp11047_c0_seq32:744-2420(+)